MRSWRRQLTRGIVVEGMRRDADAPVIGAAARLALTGREALRARPQFLAYRVQDLPAPAAARARTLLGMPVLTWTVRTPRTGAAPRASPTRSSSRAFGLRLQFTLDARSDR